MKKEIKLLLDMIDEIPCNCDGMYISRQLSSPDCPRCNYIDEEIVANAKKILGKK